MDPPPDLRGLAPGGAVHGPVAVPSSKSVASRALVCAALARGCTGLVGLPGGDDVRHLVVALRALGARISSPSPERGPGRDVLEVQGVPPGPRSGLGRSALASEADDLELSAGESGTGARLLAALLALAARPGSTAQLRVEGSMARRSSPALLRALRGAGAGIEPAARPWEGENPWPLRITAAEPPARVELSDPGSSQEVSALLLALAARPDPLELVVAGPIPSRPYVDLTIHVLAGFDVAVGESGSGERRRFRVPGPLRPPDGPLEIEPDASAAAVALAAGCLSGGEARVEGLDRASPQGDVAVLDHLAAFGCAAGVADGGLFARGRPTRGATLDLVGEPDLAPVLAAVAAAAALDGRGASRLQGLGTLPGKESPRIAVLARGLEALGLTVAEGPNSLAVGPPAGDAGAPASAPLELDARGDHRMAFAFALLGLLRPGVAVRDPGCVAKSWPSFWEDLERAGARVT